ncbi:MAG: PIN domain-containing protein [Planctomycetaceae bacterium]
MRTTVDINDALLKELRRIADDARRRVERWFEQPHVRLLVPGTDTFALFFDLLEAAGLGGNLTTDALIAAHAIEHNATLFSPDLDFGRFPDLKWIDPLA